MSLRSFAFTLSIFLSLGLKADAAPRAWLLVGVRDLPALGELEQARGETYQGQIQKQFFSGLEGLGLDPQVRWQATQSELFDALSHSESTVVFWASHANDFGMGLATPKGLVIDATEEDVTPLFRSVHPNVRFLSLIGCQVQGLLRSFHGDGWYRRNPLLRIVNLHLDLFAAPVEMKHGLEASLADLRREWQPLSGPVCRHSDDYFVELQLERSNPTSHPLKPVRVELNGRVMTVFPALAPSEKTTQSIWLTRTEWYQEGTSNFEIISGSLEPQWVELGEFTLKNALGADEWKMDIGHSGQALKSPRRALYLFQHSPSWLARFYNRPSC